MPRSFRVLIPGEPVAQGRPRAAVIGGRARVYDPKNAREWKGSAKVVMMEAVGRDRPAFPDGPLAVTIRAVFSCPKGDHRKTAPPPRRWRTKRPDLDNVAKAALDAALGIFYLDDQQVARLTVEKYTAAQGEAPFVEMEVEAL